MMEEEGRSRPRRIIVAVSGASGAIYGVRLLEILHDIPNLETHAIITSGARATLAFETCYEAGQVTELADVVYREDDLAASISSGSFPTDGMVIAPCSVKTMSGIANCYDDNLVVRAADVALKERRRLVLLVRETPLHLSHLRLMTEVTSSGGVVVPPVPAFYHHPETVDDIVNQTIGRVLDLFDLESGSVQRWQGGPAAARRAREQRGR